MQLINTIKKSFFGVINNPSITLSLVLFLILFNFMLAFTFKATTPIVIYAFMLCAFLMFCAFASGWFEIIKETFDIEKIKEKNYFSIFLEGIGKNIVPVVIAIIFLFVILQVLSMLAGYISFKIFGSIAFIQEDLMSVSQNNIDLTNYLLNLPADKIYTFYGWVFTGLITFFIYGFLFLFYFPALINDNKHNMFLKAFIAAKNSICFVFKNFLKSFLIYFSITIIYLIFGTISTFFANNFIIGIILLFLYIYFVSFVLMLIFNCYEEKNNCSDRADCVGENEVIDTTCKED